MYVLRRSSDGMFVSRPGSAASYTQFLQNAQTFATREQALGNACGNEYCIRVEEILN